MCVAAVRVDTKNEEGLPAKSLVLLLEGAVTVVRSHLVEARVTQPAYFNECAILCASTLASAMVLFVCVFQVKNSNKNHGKNVKNTHTHAMVLFIFLNLLYILCFFNDLSCFLF